MNIAELGDKSAEELTALLHEQGSANGDLPANIQRDELLYRVLRGYAEQEGYQLASGILELVSDGYGFLRQNGRRPGQNDVYVSQSQARRFNLRTGDLVLGQVRTPKESERYYGLTRVEAVNGVDPDAPRRRVSFENLTPLFPDPLLRLENEPQVPPHRRDAPPPPLRAGRYR